MAPRDLGSLMWAEACDLLEQAERMHRQFFRPEVMRSGPPRWQPPVDVFRTQDELWIIAALPGVQPDQVEVVVDGRFLVIAGVRPMPEALRQAVIHRLELPQGRFERRLELPAGRYEVGPWRLTDGCLVLNLRLI